MQQGDVDMFSCLRDLVENASVNKKRVIFYNESTLSSFGRILQIIHILEKKLLVVKAGFY